MSKQGCDLCNSEWPQRIHFTARLYNEKYNVSVNWALTHGAQVTAQFVMYRKNCSAKGRTLLHVPEVEPLLFVEEEVEEVVELSALQDQDGPPSGDGTALSS